MPIPVGIIGIFCGGTFCINDPMRRKNLPLCRRCHRYPVKFGTYRNINGQQKYHEFCEGCVKNFAPHKLPICRKCHRHSVKFGTYKDRNGHDKLHEYCANCASSASSSSSASMRGQNSIPLCNACWRRARLVGKKNGKWYTKCIYCIGWHPNSETS